MLAAAMLVVMILAIVAIETGFLVP